jgi:hypothetical protein
VAENCALRDEAMREVVLRRSLAGPHDESLTEVIGEIALPVAMTPADIDALEASCAWCLQTHRAQLTKLFLSLDRKRAVMVFRAPDAEAVRHACRGASLPVQRVWACEKR